MSKYQFFLVSLFIVLLLTLSACDNKNKTAVATVENKIKTVVACNLLTQQEIDSLFVKSPGPGGPNSPAPHIQGCVWPAEGISSLILQVLPAPADLRKSIDLGSGYRMIDVEGLSGEAVVAIQQGNPEYGTTKGLAIFGIVKGDYMLTLSPVRLDIKEGSTQFEILKELADKAIQRL